ISYFTGVPKSIVDQRDSDIQENTRFEEVQNPSPAKVHLRERSLKWKGGKKEHKTEEKIAKEHADKKNYAAPEEKKGPEVLLEEKKSAEALDEKKNQDVLAGLKGPEEMEPTSTLSSPYVIISLVIIAMLTLYYLKRKLGR
ncbi:hypothetical protein OESDEN_17832, partial [Oesophagostomum dentatum]